jgi:hypothetical protein
MSLKTKMNLLSLIIAYYSLLGANIGKSKFKDVSLKSLIHTLNTYISLTKSIEV